ncbi:MAG: LamG-like jellyroll fold domain-containing protein, partial [Reichenbachiella sp.]
PSAVAADTYDLDGDADTAEDIPFDLAGNTRSIGIVDMGAFEFSGPAMSIDLVADGGTYDFGYVASPAGSSGAITFTINNLGDDVLNLTGGPRIAISGADQGLFSVNDITSTPVSAGGNTTFTIEFQPTSLGLKTANISIDNNSDNNPYTFTIQGTGANPTALGEGDIAFTMLNTFGGEDEFGFVLLQDIGVGTEIWFTDKGWDNGLSQPSTAGEGYLRFVATTALTARTQIRLNRFNLTAYQENTSTPAGNLTMPYGSFDLNSSGDQILAFQGTVTSLAVGDVAVTNFLSAINHDITNQDEGGTEWSLNADGSDQQSELPNTLTNRVNAIALFPGSDALQDNGVYDNGNTHHSGTLSGILSAANDPARWNFQASTLYTSVNPFTANTAPSGLSQTRYSGTGVIRELPADLFGTDTDQIDQITAVDITSLNTISNIGALFFDANDDGIREGDNSEDLGSGSYPLPLTVNRADLDLNRLKLEIDQPAGNSGSFDFANVTDGEATDAGTYSFTVNIIDNALNFDGSDDYVDFPSLVSAGMAPATTNFTLEAWVRTENVGNQTILYIGTTGSDTDVTLKANASDVFVVNSNGHPGPTSSGFLVSNGASPATWHHVAAVYDGTDLSLYVDGILQGSDNTFAFNIDYSVFRIGDSGATGTPWNGDIDEVRIWNIARSPQELRQNATTTVFSHANLVAAYDFNTGNPGNPNAGEDRLEDITPNTTDGILDPSFALTGTTGNWVTSTALQTTGLQKVAMNGQGTGDITAGSTSLSALNSTFFGRVSQGNQGTKVFELTNTGLNDLNVNTISLTNGTEFAISDDQASGGTLSPGETRTITIDYNPTDNNNHTDQVSIDSDDPSSPFSFDIAGTSQIDAALHFDGADDNVNLGNGISYALDDFTWEAWIKPTDVSVSRAIFSKDASGETQPLNVHIMAGGQVKFSSRVEVNSVATLAVDTWYHIAAVREGNTHSLYINGDLDNQNVTTALTLAANTRDVTIGNRVGGDMPFAGTIDGVRIWQVALTEPEIEFSMMNELGGGESDLTAAFRLDEGTIGASNVGTETAIDLTGTYPGNLDIENDDAATGFDFGTADVNASNWITSTVFESDIYIEESVAQLEIENGDNDATDEADNTDFGSIAYDGGTVVRTFNIRNLGGQTLDLLSASAVSVGSTDFSITAQPGQTLASGGLETFDITFDPSSPGVKNATVTITSNDPDEAPYQFAITGTGTGTQNALTFDGTNDFVDVSAITGGHALSDNGDNYTIEAWIQLTAITGNPQTIVSFTNGLTSAEPHLSLMIDATGNLQFFKRNNAAGEALSVVSPNPLTISGEWYHVAISKENNDYRLYVNGQEVASSIGVTTNAGTYNRTRAFIGAGYSADSGGNQIRDYFGGQIDDLKIWNVRRSQTEIIADGLEQLPAVVTNLVAYYNFDETTGTTLNDQTSNAYHGTVFGESGQTAAGSTTTVINLATSPFTGGELVGRTLHIINEIGIGVESQTVSANTTNTITVGTPFSGAPVADVAWAIEYNDPTFNVSDPLNASQSSIALEDGSSNGIAGDGSNSPAVGNSTDFGSLGINSTQDVTYNIVNTGLKSVSVTSVMSGNDGVFNMSSFTPGAIAPG